MTENELEKEYNVDVNIQGEVEAVLPKNKDAYIIDLGCGYGSFLHTLQKRGYTKLFGVEVGKEQNRFLNSKGLNVIQQDIFEYLKSDNKTYDVITLFDVLEHFKKNEIVELLPLLDDRLRSGGVLIVRVPNGEAVFKGSIMYSDFTHETYFTKRSMMQLFKTFGFEGVDVLPVYDFGKTIKARVARCVYLMCVNIYKRLLMVDNYSSYEYFLPTQNILGVVKK